MIRFLMVYFCILGHFSVWGLLLGSSLLPVTIALRIETSCGHKRPRGFSEVSHLNGRVFASASGNDHLRWPVAAWYLATSTAGLEASRALHAFEQLEAAARSAVLL